MREDLLSKSARKVLAIADDTARQLSHPHVGSEHLLVGCVGGAEGTASAALEAFGVTLREVCAEVERLPAGKAGPSHDGVRRLDDHAQAVVRLASDETRESRRSVIEPDDVFAGILRYGQSDQGRGAGSSLVLSGLGIKLLPLRLKVLELAGDSHSVSIGGLPTLFELDKHLRALEGERTEALSSGALGRAERLSGQENLLRVIRASMTSAEPSGSVRPGVTLGGRYRMDELIGRGGMGEVWRGTDDLLGRTVAVKLLLPAMLGEPGFAERFRGEARTMATINHPGVVDVYDYGSDQQLAFLILEYVEGDALSRILSRVGRLTPARTMALVAQAADALQAAHANGIVHRDVKPGNLLVRPNGTLVLTDFGIARSALVGQLTATGSVLGTASYISPEQVAGAVATAASDVYSLGVVAYQCLTGHRPFDGATPIEIAMKHVRENPPPLPADIPPQVRLIVERAMSKDPAARWPAANALAAVARQAASSLTTAAQQRMPYNASAPVNGRPSDPGTGVLMKAVGSAPVQDTAPTTVVPAITPQPVNRSRLPKARHSVAVLIGTAHYDDAEMPDIPGVVNNIADLAAALADTAHGGFYRRRIHEIVDPGMDLATRVHQAVENITDTVLIYYSGHGVLSPDGNLYLGLKSTRRPLESYTSMAYDTLRRLLIDSPATNKVVILDCCFSGKADLMSAGVEQAVIGQLEVEGTYVLTATSAAKPAHAPEGSRNSAFTGALVELLHEGLREGGELLPFRDMFEPLSASLRRRGFPAPQQKGSNTIDRLALTRNPAWTSTAH